MISMSTDQKDAFATALRKAFNSDTFYEMMSLKVGRSVDEIAGSGIPFRTIVVRTVDDAERGGWLYELLDGARRANPDNYYLKRFATQFATFTPVDDALERMVLGSKKFVDIGTWRQRIWEIEGQVCNIRFDGEFGGTGFLVAPDVVMTNYHVINKVKHALPLAPGEKEGERTIEPEQIELVFDYKRTPQGEINNGTRFGVAVEQWLIDAEPFSAVDRVPRELKKEKPKLSELDYALLRVAGVPGDDKRGFIKVTGERRNFRSDQALFIAQHPCDEYDRQMPLQLALETNAEVEVNDDEERTRVYYRTRTTPGSSGSPCFDYEWNLIAIHHSGDPELMRDATYNEGIPIETIYRHVVETKGLTDVFG